MPTSRLNGIPSPQTPSLLCVFDAEGGDKILHAPLLPSVVCVCTCGVNLFHFVRFVLMVRRLVALKSSCLSSRCEYKWPVISGAGALSLLFVRDDYSSYRFAVQEKQLQGAASWWGRPVGQQRAHRGRKRHTRWWQCLLSRLTNNKRQPSGMWSRTRDDLCDVYFHLHYWKNNNTHTQNAKHQTQFQTTHPSASIPIPSPTNAKFTVPYVGN